MTLTDLLNLMEDHQNMDLAYDGESLYELETGRDVYRLDELLRSRWHNELPVMPVLVQFFDAPLIDAYYQEYKQAISNPYTMIVEEGSIRMLFDMLAKIQITEQNRNHRLYHWLLTLIRLIKEGPRTVNEWIDECGCFIKIDEFGVISHHYPVNRLSQLELDDESCSKESG